MVSCGPPDPSRVRRASPRFTGRPPLPIGLRDHSYRQVAPSRVSAAYGFPGAARVGLPVSGRGGLAVGAAAAGLHGAVPAPRVVAAVATGAAGGSLSAAPAAAAVLAAVGWLTVAGFSQPPYAQLRLTGPWT